MSPSRSFISSSPEVSTAKKSTISSGNYAIPLFYAPRAALTPDSIFHELNEIDEMFGGFNDGIPVNDFIPICKDFCGFPTFFNGPLVLRIISNWELFQNKEQGMIDTRVYKKQFIHFFENELNGFDELDRFFRLIKQPESDFIVVSDFAPYLEELLAFHPGLEFLESTPEFQEKYARTVIARILYEVNAGRNGEITRREFRQSDLLEACKYQVS